MDNKKVVNKENGVTLIALVMTIIILLIIAGVTVSSLTGDHGTVDEAKNTVSDIEHASITEEVMKMTMIVPEYDEEQIEYFLNGMVSDGMSSKYEITDRTEDSLKVEIWNAKGDKSYSYIISNTSQYGLRVQDESETFPNMNYYEPEEENVQTNTSVENTTTNTTTNTETNTSSENSYSGGGYTNTSTNTNTSGGGNTEPDEPDELFEFSGESNILSNRYSYVGTDYDRYGNYYDVYYIYGTVKKGVRSASFTVTVNKDDPEFTKVSTGFFSSYSIGLQAYGNSGVYSFSSDKTKSNEEYRFGTVYIPR